MKNIRPIDPETAMRLMHGNARHISQHMFLKPVSPLEQLLERPDEAMTKSVFSDSSAVQTFMQKAYDDRNAIARCHTSRHHTDIHIAHPNRLCHKSQRRWAYHDISV